VILAVELCSLTLQRQDMSMANLISSRLFGDGAAAVVVAGSDCGLRGPKILATRSVFYADTEEMMGWDVSEDGFRIVLSPEVPELIRRQLGSDVDRFLADLGRSRKEVEIWIMHTGGPKVLQATASALGLENGELAASWDCLRRTGKLSSASVLVVLEEVMKNRRPAPGTLGLLAAMGPGFCSELMALEW
jgi:alkylresorcinol/alkylpyrone synthase